MKGKPKISTKLVFQCRIDPVWALEVKWQKTIKCQLSLSTSYMLGMPRALHTIIKINKTNSPSLPRVKSLKDGNMNIGLTS